MSVNIAAKADTEQLVSVQLTMEQWNFIASGLRDLATSARIRMEANQYDYTDEYDTDVAVSRENLELADELERQVYAPTTDEPLPEVCGWLVEGNRGPDWVSLYWGVLNGTQQHTLTQEVLAAIAEGDY